MIIYFCFALHYFLIALPYFFLILKDKAHTHIYIDLNSCINCKTLCCCFSVPQSGLTLWDLHGLQHTRFLCPSPSPGACSSSCPLSWRCYLTISSSVSPLLLLPSIFPSIKVFSNESALCIRGPKYWSFSISPSNEYSGLSPLGLTGLISLQSKGLSRLFCSTTVQKHPFFRA